MRNKSTSRQRTQRAIRRIDLAYTDLASSEIARDINRNVVLELIRTNQPVSRAGLTALSGLQPSTISLIVDQLLKEKWVAEGAVTQSPRGRPATLLSLNANMAVIAVDIRSDRAIIAVVDLSGRFLSRESWLWGDEAKHAITDIIAAVRRIISRYFYKFFVGIGISLPGHVDPATQRLVRAPSLPWSPDDLKKAIEKKIRLHVEVDTAANSCLLSELWFGGMDGVRNAVLVMVAEEIDSAILANGRLVTGIFGLAGDFGHVSLDPNGPRCTGCGRHGCWEVFASSKAALCHYAELKPDAPIPTTGELLKLARENDDAAIKALRQHAANLSQGLFVITSALSPEVILLAGELTVWPQIEALVEAELAQKMLAGEPPRIAITSDVDAARLRGAAILVLQHHSGYNSSPLTTPRVKATRRQRGC